MAVDVARDVPAVRGEALRRVVGEPAAHLAVDRDAVVVVEADQLAELLRARERARLVRDALHEAAVAAEEIGVVIDDRRLGAVELRRERALRERHADRVRDALAERPGRRLDARRHADLGVARGLAVQLAEVAQLAHRQVVAGEVQQRVDQHRAMAVGQHEAIAVGPLRVARVVAQVAAPQRDGDLGHAHGRAGVAGVGLLHGVHRERADRVDDVGVGGFGARGLRAGGCCHWRKNNEKCYTEQELCDYTCALFHSDIFRLGKPLQEGFHPPPWV